MRRAVWPTRCPGNERSRSAVCSHTAAHLAWILVTNVATALPLILAASPGPATHRSRSAAQHVADRTAANLGRAHERHTVEVFQALSGAHVHERSRQGG
jgi:hypothetical protein